VPACLAAPSSTGRVPGAIVLHDAAGMSQDYRNQADWLAEAGSGARQRNCVLLGFLSMKRGYVFSQRAA
jgi:hypothetical protein